MEEFLNPPCNTLFATFFEVISKKCQKKSVILFEDISSSQPDTESIVRAAVSASAFDAPEEKAAGDRGEESPVESPEGPVENRDVCEKEAGTEAGMQHEDVDDVGGVDDVRVSGYESEGFTVSELLRRKRLASMSVSEGVVDTSQIPQCEFSNLHHLPLNFLLKILWWPVIEFS